VGKADPGNERDSAPSQVESNLNALDEQLARELAAVGVDFDIQRQS
jgi:hypothetical protein